MGPKVEWLTWEDKNLLNKIKRKQNMVGRQCDCFKPKHVTYIIVTQNYFCNQEELIHGQERALDEHISKYGWWF